MKKKHFFSGMLLLLSVAVALSWPSCTQDDQVNELDLYKTPSKVGQKVEVATDNNSLLRCARINGIMQASVEIPDTACHVVYKALYAGQTIRIGYVRVANDSKYLYVEYNMNWGEPWVFSETHVYAGDPGNIPLTKSGNPKVGNFPYSAEHNPTVKSFGYAIPLSSLEEYGNAGSKIVVLAHAVVLKLDADNVVVQEETAWAGCDPLLEDNGNWATYVNYTIAQCGEMETYTSSISSFFNKPNKKGGKHN